MTRLELLYRNFTDWRTGAYAASAQAMNERDRGCLKVLISDMRRMADQLEARLNEQTKEAA